jgi:hypothetical protein
MKPISRMLVVCALFMLPMTAMAKGGGKKNKETKPVTVTGVLGDKAAGAAETVLAQLTDVKSTDKKAKDTPPATLDLVGSTDATTTQIKDLLAKKANVKVTGTISGTTMTVTSIEEAAAGGGKKGKKNK